MATDAYSRTSFVLCSSYPGATRWVLSAQTHPPVLVGLGRQAYFCTACPTCPDQRQTQGPQLPFPCKPVKCAQRSDKEFNILPALKYWDWAASTKDGDFFTEHPVLWAQHRNPHPKALTADGHNSKTDRGHRSGFWAARSRELDQQRGFQEGG